MRPGEPIAVPETLGQALAGRLASLSEQARHLLLGLAAISRPDEAILRGIEPHARAAIEEGIKAQVLERREGELRFIHPLVASVIYGMSDPADRHRWHAQLARLVADREERARHLALAASGPDESVAASVEEAARLANTRGAPDAAAELAEQAADLTPPALQGEAERRRIMTAEYRLRTGDVPEALAMLRAILSASDWQARPAEALRLMGNILFSLGDLQESEQSLADALARTGDDAERQAMILRDLILAVS